MYNSPKVVILCHSPIHEVPKHLVMQRVRGAALTYHRALQRHPLLIKSVSSGCVVSASDASVQLATEPSYNPRRTALIGIGYGSLWFAPVMHVVTTRFWPAVLPSTAPGALALKAGVDMITSFPMNLSYMLAVQAFARGVDVEQSVRKNAWASLSNGWLLWTPATALMYGVVTPHYRVLFMNGVSFGWNAFLIWRFNDPSSSSFKIR